MNSLHNKYEKHKIHRIHKKFIDTTDEDEYFKVIKVKQNDIRDKTNLFVKSYAVSKKEIKKER